MKTGIDKALGFGGLVFAVACSSGEADGSKGNVGAARETGDGNTGMFSLIPFRAIKRRLGPINRECSLRAMLAVMLAFLAVPQAFSQADPTAIKKVPLSFFGGVSGVYTGLLGSKNLSITAGADLRLRDVFGLAPSVEIRGTYPMIRGHVVSQKNILAGLRVDKTFGRFTPYGNILFGLGQLTYQPLRANPANTFAYSYSSSNVISPGAGFDFEVTPTWGIKADGQFQRYSTPVTESSHIYAKSLTLGVVYHLFAGSGPR